MDHASSVCHLFRPSSTVLRRIAEAVDDTFPKETAVCIYCQTEDTRVNRQVVLETIYFLHELSYNISRNCVNINRRFMCACVFHNFVFQTKINLDHLQFIDKLCLQQLIFYVTFPMLLVGIVLTTITSLYALVFSTFLIFRRK